MPTAESVGHWFGLMFDFNMGIDELVAVVVDEMQ